MGAGDASIGGLLYNDRRTRSGLDCASALLCGFTARRRAGGRDTTHVGSVKRVLTEMEAAGL